MPRKKKANRKSLERLPEGKLVAPKTPAQAKKYLRAVADHLTSFANAPNSYCFVGRAIRRFLNNPEYGLMEALRLVPRKPAKRPGHKPVALMKVKDAAKMMAEGADVP